MSRLNKKITELKKDGKTTIGLLAVYDLIILVAATVVVFIAYRGSEGLSQLDVGFHFLVAGIFIYLSRIAMNVYGQVWRYGGIQSFMKLMIADALAFILYYVFQIILPFMKRAAFPRCLSYICLVLLFSLAMRMSYRYAYKCGRHTNSFGKFMCSLIKAFSFGKIVPEQIDDRTKITVAIVGAGTVGCELADKLMNDGKSSYLPRLFIDNSDEKIGRTIHDLKVVSPEDVTQALVSDYEIKEIIFAISNLDVKKLREMCEHYVSLGLKVKIYDSMSVENAEDGKRRLREFDIEDLLFRKHVDMTNEETNLFYTGKTILITGGGGSIGSELCRQLARMSPKSIIILDIYENGAYDVQQELKIAYGKEFDVNVEIVSVCNRIGLERVFSEYRPEIVVMAAAHKHVPLMEKNCIEAVENNVFGTLNTVELSEKYGVERVIMVSTDKAVNPTNIMGATKRVCEMIVMAHAKRAKEEGLKTTYSATRFGNVLGSAGSVIPLFRRQIANGGPVTITDKRMIRYFMTIPEASQLVLQSGAMAQNGELFVLDMGKPVKIYDLAENMIKLSGLVLGRDIDIVEIGLRPGEKLYEELLIQSETLSKTSNKLIYIEKDDPIEYSELLDKLQVLRNAIESNSDEKVREALHSVVPTFIVNKKDDRKLDIFESAEEKDKATIDDCLVGKHILIVDDVGINREMAADTLEELGMKCDVAVNGSNAVDMVRNSGSYFYDAVLMDVEMPVMNGIEATKAIRALKGEEYKKLPVIAISAGISKERVSEIFAVGVDEYIEKPLHLDELTQVLERYIRK